MRTVKLDYDTAEALAWMDPGDSAGEEEHSSSPGARWKVVAHEEPIPWKYGYTQLTVIRDTHSEMFPLFAFTATYHHTEGLEDIDVEAFQVVAETVSTTRWVPVE